MTTDGQLLRDDERARGQALDVTQSFIVQAPAGSGKTELLIQRYLKLLATVDNPEEILAITFTRKAAAEMQLRVLQALRNARKGHQPDEPHLQLTAGFAVDVLRRDRERDWRLIDNPRRMRIQTLDSLNASIARSQPLSSPSGASASAIVVDSELKNLYRRAAAATLDWLAEEGALQDATREVLLHVDTNTWLYVAYLSRMLETRDQWLPFIATGLGRHEDAAALRLRFERSLAFIVGKQLDATCSAFPQEYSEWFRPLAAYAADNLLSDGKGDDPICELRDLEDLPSTDVASRDAWLAVAGILLTRKGEWRKTVTRNQGFPPGDSGEKKAFLDLLEALGKHDRLRRALNRLRDMPPVSYSDEQWRVLLALFRLLPLAVGELQRLFNEHALTDHIQVAMTASQALGTAENPGDVALLLDYQVRHLLVDEMQDTSSAQYRMLEALTGGWEPGDGRTLFCVGDPMQSIYRFRNAEVGQFLLARKNGIGSIPLTPLVLRRNFRSGEHLVDWFNRVFPTVLPEHDDATYSAVSYAPAVPVDAHIGHGTVNYLPVFGADVHAEAQRGLEVVRRTLDENPDDDMAILVRSRTQLPALLALLRQNGIAYQAVDIDRLTDLPEVIEILALTRACVHPGDRLAWLAILRAPWVGLGWADLHRLVCNDAQSTVWELLDDEERVSAVSVTGREALGNAMPVLETLVRGSRTLSLRDRVERAWLSLGGPSIVEDEHAIEHVYRCLDVIEKHEVAGSLPDIAELASILDLEHVSNDVTARLQVLTMHRAKGLQFDHVLLYGMGRVPGRSAKEVLNWFDIPDEHGEEQKIISPVGPRGDLQNDPIHHYIEVSDNAKDAYEQGRLLYVACTRAKKSLHISGNVRLTTDADGFKRPDPRSLLHMLWDDAEPAFAAAIDNLSPGPTESGSVDWYEPRLRRFSERWTLPDAEPPPGTRSADAPVSDEPDVEFYWVGSAARIAGTIVHRWLQLVAQKKVEAGAAGDHATTIRWLTEMGVGERLLEDVCERVDAALDGVRTDEKGAWLLDGDGHAELALSGMLDGEIVSVVIDRVRIDDNDQHWIVDYKTSTHEGGGLDSFLQAESDRYRDQLARYAALYSAWAQTPVRCALYFPLLQAFVEVET
ncbi:MAG: UvrD-helicase domain-containing protein [Woeseiaceae bacterium]|nr:UvrD-helicase domain-containing protein [Woeseiaceae bacterium]